MQMLEVPMSTCESQNLTELEAYHRAIRCAQSSGLRGAPTAYSFLQMSLGEYGDEIAMVTEALQADTMVWVFACTGAITRSLPDGSTAGYMAFAIDAITGVPISPPAHHPSGALPKERPFTVIERNQLPEKRD